MPDAGYGHISVMGLKSWKETFRSCGFQIDKIKRGPILAGGEKADKKRFIFGLIMLIEIFLDFFPLLKNLSEDVLICLRKPQV